MTSRFSYSVRNLEMLSDDDLSNSCEDIAVRKISSASCGAAVNLEYSNNLFQGPDDKSKRQHHNALERKRRDHIKDSFTLLKEAVPSLKNEKASRATILRKGADYIQFMQGRNKQHERDIAEIKRQNAALEAEIRAICESRGIAVDLDGVCDADNDEMDFSADADDRPQFCRMSSSNSELTSNHQYANLSPVITTSAISQSIGLPSRKWSAPARYISAEELLKQAEIAQYQQQHKHQQYPVIAEHPTATTLAAAPCSSTSIGAGFRPYRREDSAELSGSGSTVSICDL